MPGPGEVSIRISNSTFERNSLNDRFFTTKELKARGIVITIEDSLFKNINLEKESMFEFKHNFRLVNPLCSHLNAKNFVFNFINPNSYNSMP